MAITLDGTSGITTPDITSEAGLTVDGVSFASGAPANTLVTTSGGNVGVGTSSPSQLLDVRGSSSPTIKVRNTAAVVNNISQVLFEGTNTFSGTSTSYIQSISLNAGNSSTALAFGTNADGGGAAAERARIDSSGNLLVGTTSGTVGTAHHLIQAGNELNLAASIGNSTIYFNYKAGTTLTALRFMNGNSAGGYVACYGTSFTNSSDYRIKTDVQEVGAVLEKVSQLRPVNYIKEGVEGREFGLIAHEAQALFPDMVSGAKDAVDEDGDMEIQGIDYAQLSTILVKAVQEQQALITAQQTAIETLEARVAALEAA